MKKIEPEHQTADECYKTDKNSPNKSHKNEDTTAKPDTEIIGKMKKIAFWGFVFIGLYLIISNLPIFAPKEIDPKAGLLIVFFVGFLTSFHCIGMCSGLILAYSTNNEDKGLKPHACYNLGRVVSYTALGVLLGFIGSVIAITDQIRGFISLLAGIFLFLYGLSIFYPKLRKYTIIPSFNISHKITKNPTLIGLLNGFMPCGPLQAMLIYSAGTGSPIQGGLTMLAFALGTVPLMFLAGATFTRINMKLASNATKFASLLMIVLGIIMLQRSALLLGLQLPIVNNYSFLQSVHQSDSFKDGYQTIYMNITKYGWEPSTLLVVKGVPVRWVVTANELNYCNKGIKVPKLGISYTFSANGEQKIFEFTPNETGTIYFTCWMGMIPGEIKVVESVSDLNKTNTTAARGTSGCGCGGGCHI